MLQKSLSILFILLLFSGSCASSNQQNDKAEGQEIVRALIKELKPIRSREQLVQRSPKIKKIFNQLAEILIKAKEHQLYECTNEIDSDQTHAQYYSNQLKEELNRLYRLDGGKETIENCQKDALERLDQFEQKIRKRKTKTI